MISQAVAGLDLELGSACRDVATQVANSCCRSEDAERLLSRHAHRLCGGYSPWQTGDLGPSYESLFLHMAVVAVGVQGGATQIIQPKSDCDFGLASSSLAVSV